MPCASVHAYFVQAPSHLPEYLLAISRSPIFIVIVPA